MVDIGEMPYRAPADETINVPPHASRLYTALRSIGYRFEQAIADLVDNSINAKARNVLVRFETDSEGIRSLYIVDDGDGMTSSEISEAMRFGSHEDYDVSSLGKYGMGLKLASMSHAKVLIVASRTVKTSIEARRWTPEGIANDWSVDVLPETTAREIFDKTYQGIKTEKSGTIVKWEEVDQITVSSRGLTATIKTLQNRLKKSLGMTFHRFIEDKRLSIFIDQIETGKTEKDNYQEVQPLNPFKFNAWPTNEYPRTFHADIYGVGKLVMKAYVCPPNSNAPEYKLGGNAAARQGFYFYRNDRLIQAGGWNGLIESESEPHGSLARVKVDLPETLDKQFGLNVQKSAVITPPAFSSAVQDSNSADNISFDDFRRTANEIYRKHDKRSETNAPMVVSGEIPKQITDLAKRWNRDETGKFRHVKVLWQSFDGPELFIVDQKRDRILLNERYRKEILGRRHRTGQDVPLLKTTVFFLLKDSLQKKRISKKEKERLTAMEEVMRAAAKLGNG